MQSKRILLSNAEKLKQVSKKIRQELAVSKALLIFKDRRNEKWRNHPKKWKIM